VSEFGNRTKPVATLDTRPPLSSVGLVCVCGKAVASIEGVARTCDCGRIWVISAMQIGCPRG
jgi:hypothetical protein